MLASITSTLGALSKATGIFQTWAGAKKAQEKETQEAMRAFLTALAETKSTLAHQSIAEIPAERKNQLSRMWMDVAIGFIKIDDQLADTFMLKGLWWASPDQWNYDHTQALKISFEQLELEARKLLKS